MGGKCCLCGYNKNIAALEFHHIDKKTKLHGISDGNCRKLEKDIEEVKKCALVCANCHREIEASGLKLESTFDENKYQEYLSTRTPSAIKYCKVCGKEISQGADTGLCLSCSCKSRRKCERPSRDWLKRLIREKTFVDIGNMYGVTDNAVRKWCDKHELPRTKRAINSYSDEKWDLI